jgi:hypothetical protein
MTINSKLNSRIMKASAKLQKKQPQNTHSGKNAKAAVQLSWGSAMRR